MEITTQPADYSGIFSQQTYTVGGCDPTQITEVEILCDGQVVGIKRFRGETSYDINVSNYLRRRLDIAPIAGGQAGIVTGTGRSVRVAIKVGSLQSPWRTMTAGRLDMPQQKLLSKAPPAVIARGEIDELSFAAPQKSVYAKVIVYSKGPSKTITLPAKAAAGDICTMVLDTKDIASAAGIERWSDISQMYVNIYADNRGIINRRYEACERAKDAVRLCWLNPYGAVDYYTFRAVGSKMQVAKSKVYAQSGYTTSAGSTEAHTTLISEYEPTETIKWLADIVSSPAVWIAEKSGGFTPVDVVTEVAEIRSDKPLSLTLEIRPRQKTAMQRG